MTVPVSRPEAASGLGPVPARFAGDYAVVVEPDKDEAEWWGGAPSVVRDDQGVFWLACRMRTADEPRGLRGYEIRIFRSENGIRFEHAHSIKREDVPIPGFERPALLRDPETGAFKLYGCGPWDGGPWTIIKFDDAPSPAELVASTGHPVIQAPPKAYEHDVPPTGYKDQVIIHAEGGYHCYVIGILRETERIFHFTSADGENWTPAGHPNKSLLPLDGWHDFYVRPASVLPLGCGYLFVYEGSSTAWYDPVYNVATGLGFTFDLHNVTDLTPDGPMAVSSTPSEHFATLRYSSWLFVEDELWVYAEAARPNMSNETRLFRFKR